MDNPFISIALATYNGERFLKEQLDSIYNQTYKNFEVVVTDDCSSDKTVEILEVYKEEYNLKYSVNKTNIGLVRNFEKTLSKCKGDYIALADQDDIWLQPKIETLVRNIQFYSLICSDAYLIDQSGEIISNSFRKYSNLPIMTGKPFKLLVFDSFVTGCTTMVKREVVDVALPIPSGVRFHDWWLSIIATTLNGIIYLNKPLVYYRQHFSNITGAQKTFSLAKSVKRFIIGKRPEKKLQGSYKRRILLNQRIKAMENSTVFNRSEKDFLKDVRNEYLYDYFKTDLHLKAFRFALRNKDYLYARVENPIKKIIYLLSELIL